VLLLCLGKATRVVQYLMSSPKTYEAEVRLGISTATHDAEGEITGRAEVQVAREDVLAALGQFVGPIEQVPPMHSAIKHDGKRLYQLARQGVNLQIPPRKVDIYTLELLEWVPPFVRLSISCGPGTYIRALARDLGTALGCGGYLSALRRTRSGQFSVEEAVTLQDLEKAFVTGTGEALLHSLDVAFADLPAFYVGLEEARRLAMGQQLDAGRGPEGRREARVYAPDREFVAVVRRDEQTGCWLPHHVFVTPEDLSYS